MNFKLLSKYSSHMNGGYHRLKFLLTIFDTLFGILSYYPSHRLPRTVEYKFQGTFTGTSVFIFCFVAFVIEPIRRWIEGIVANLYRILHLYRSKWMVGIVLRIANVVESAIKNVSNGRRRICRWNHVSVFSVLAFSVYASRLLDLKGFRLFQGGGTDQKRRKHIEATGRDKKTRLLVDSLKLFGGRTSQTAVYSSNSEGTVRPSFTLFPWFFVNMDESLLPSCRSSLLRQWVNLFGLVEKMFLRLVLARGGSLVVETPFVMLRPHRNGESIVSGVIYWYRYDHRSTSRGPRNQRNSSHSLNNIIQFPIKHSPYQYPYLH